MNDSNVFKTKLVRTLCCSIFIFIVSCNGTVKKKVTFYRAVNGKDTATLKLYVNEKKFTGQYEILYHNTGKDSGVVRGDFKGDTLRGDFKYLTYGGSWKRIPIALLKSGDSLISGTGVIGTYLGLPCFVPEVQLNYSNPKFVFKKVSESLE